MINDIILDEMDLPLSSTNEDIETISSNKFRPLFDLKKFEIRSETFRDKGIDFYIEIKRKNLKDKIAYLNFHFAIQLKATDSKKLNKDGSISLQLDTGNINYLLNNPMPAFYVLYFSSTDTFYYENINDFAKSLYKKNENWNSQSSHILRFNRKLDADGIDEMYELTLQKGKFQRTINEKNIIQSIAVNKGEQLLVDSELNVFVDSEIRELIEEIGLNLVNEGRWKEVIDIHKKATGYVASSAKYSLVLGIANYYNGNLIDALSFFKLAKKLKIELNEELKNYLKYFETTVKYSIGLISEIEYNQKVLKLESSENVGLYIRLINVKNNYVESVNSNSIDRYEKIIADVNRIIDDPKANNSLKLIARCELILFEGLKNNIDYVESVSILNILEEKSGASLKLRRNALLGFSKAYDVWVNNAHMLKNEANEKKNYFAFFTALVNEIKIIYEFEVFTSLTFVVQVLPDVTKSDKSARKQKINEMLDRINKAYKYFKHIGHMESIIISLFTKYEILHFIKKYKEANEVINELDDIIDTYELTYHKNKLNVLKNSGTAHEQFKIWQDEMLRTIGSQSNT